MAKGSAMGVWKGKKGTSVFYRIKNSNNKQVQGIRERVYDPANPQTSSQAGQRMKMLPAQRMANVLKPIIERGFEGVKYGPMSRNAFLKYALKQNSGFPATSKDDSKVWPGEYLISKGSLPEITCEFNATDVKAIFSLGCDTPGLTVGTLSADLLAENSYLQAGDQITLCLCETADFGTPNDAVPVWRTVSFILDANDTTTLASLGLTVTVETNHIAIGVDEDLEYFVAAGLILSRESSTGGHLRSNCRVKLTDSFADFLFSNAALVEARKSYMKQDQVQADWYEEQPEILGETVESLYTLSGLTGYMATCNGTQVKVRVDNNTGDLRAVYVKTLDNQDMEYMALVNQNGYAVGYPGEGLVANYLKPSDVSALASLPVFTVGA